MKRRWMPHVRPDQAEPPEPVDFDALERAIDEDADRRRERALDKKWDALEQRAGGHPRKVIVTGHNPAGRPPEGGSDA